MTLYCFAEKKECCTALAERIRDTCCQALRERQVCSIVLSGGATPLALYELLASAEWRSQIEWSRVHVFFGDERCVAPEHHDSNYKMARDAMLKSVDIPVHQIHRMYGENVPETEAVRYEEVIKAFFLKYTADEPMFDLTLLGLGGDGHTASLFPEDKKALASTSLVVAVDAPKAVKPAVKRVSLTLRGLARTRNVFFFVHGENKKGILEAVLLDTAGKYPAAMVYGKTLSWYFSGINCSDLSVPFFS